MSRGDKTHPTSSERGRREFSRGLFGYRRKEVDARLAEIDATMAQLQSAGPATPSAEHLDLVHRATRRRAAEVLERAHADAERIRAEAASILADARATAGTPDPENPPHADVGGLAPPPREA